MFAVYYRPDLRPLAEEFKSRYGAVDLTCGGELSHVFILGGDGTLLEALRRFPCVLVPDFRGDEAAVASVVYASPDVFAHNVETVRRLTPYVRDPRASYERSLAVLKMAKDLGAALTKSGIMLGLGESFEEVVETLDHLRRADVDIVTIGQYLRPGGSPRHLKPARYVTPEEFERLAEVARSMGFKAVAAGPLVRSSYRSYYLYKEALKNIVYIS